MPPSIAIKLAVFAMIRIWGNGPSKKARRYRNRDGESIIDGVRSTRERGAKQSLIDLESWMVRYQRADPEAQRALTVALSPALLRFFRSQIAIREQADDLLQETWMRIHRVRHTYRPGEPVLPWVYAIARRVGIDGDRRIRRIRSHESAMDVLQEKSAPVEARSTLPAFDTLVAALPEAQREVVTMMKAGGLSLEEVARVLVVSRYTQSN